MSEMVERVARAIHDMHGAGPAYELYADDWNGMARVAIEAMKVRASGISGMTLDAQTRAQCAREYAAWYAMIDAALSTKQPERVVE